MLHATSSSSAKTQAAKQKWNCGANHVSLQLHNNTIITPWKHGNHNTNLCHISNYIQCDISKCFMKVSANNINPGGTVPCVRVGLVQRHDMSKVWELGILLFYAHLENGKHKTTTIENNLGIWKYHIIFISLKTILLYYNWGLRMSTTTNLGYPFSNILTERSWAVKVLN